jgi:anion-transporting  ArsA/GET3 family ATPase
VVDLPATGHSVAWLRVPRQGKDFLGEGPLFELCDRVAKELLAPSRSSIVVVSLPEKLVLEETLELCGSIERDAGMPVDRIVVNRVPVALPRGALEDARDGRGRSRGPARQLPSRRWPRCSTARAAASASALSALEALTHREHDLWRLPLAAVDPRASEVARWLREEGAA